MALGLPPQLTLKTSFEIGFQTINTPIELDHLVVDTQNRQYLRKEVI